MRKESNSQIFVNITEGWQRDNMQRTWRFTEYCKEYISNDQG